jgi:putative ABC transport system permease protein
MFDSTFDPRFNLDKTLATWRHSLRHNRVFLAEDLEELEVHLRDHIEAMVAEGLPEEEAFRRATDRLGFYAELETEYRKVRFGRRKRRRHLIQQAWWEVHMLKNYVKIAVRALRRHPGFTFINVFGLAVGVACSLLIVLFVRHELSYDTFHAKGDRIFRPSLHLELNGVPFHEASIQFPAAEALQREYPEIEAAVRLYIGNPPLLGYEDRQYTEERFFFADSTFFEVFDFPLVNGDAQTVLDGADGVVLTERAARKYFGDADPVGKVLSYDSRFSLRVAGVARDLPENAHFQFDFVAPMAFQLGIWRSQSGDQGRENKWFWTGAWTYLLLKDAAAAPALEARLPAFVDKYFPELYQDATLTLQPLRSIHLHSHLDNELGPNGNVLFVYLFSAIALVVLVIACINFANLTAVQAMGRAREVGVRKSLGAGRSQVNAQLLGEGLLLSTIAVGLAVGLAYVLLPVFNGLAGTHLRFGALASVPGVAALVLLTTGIGLLPGLYPALYLSRLSPVSILRGSVKTGAGGTLFRHALVTVQFTTSIALMIGVGVIFQQVRYVQQRDLGFDRAHVVVVKPRAAVSRQYDAFREALLQHPALRGVATTSYVPGKGSDGYRFVPEGHAADEPLMMPLNFADDHFTDVLGIPVKEGRWFSKDFPADASEGFVVNEQALRMLGWTENPLGRQLQLLAPGTTDVWRTGPVVGVIHDYHFESLHNPLKPLVLAYGPGGGHYLVKVDGARMAEALAHLDRTWKQFSPDWPINRYFLDQDLQALYNREQRLGEMVAYLTLLAVLIACLGLVGLGSFTAARRKKEICIRKVHGATLPRVLMLLYSGYVRLLALSFVLAAPVAYYGMRRWLEHFAYHTPIRPGVFVLAGLAALVVAGLSVAYPSVRAAWSNPADVLRHE